mmetsp:Transcript_101129/g.286661  ORF Transcript_101129/g.286661 Transcript_101129/m.286661 type:complete len:325 (+) Transcript_101129:577-1551(+)
MDEGERLRVVPGARHHGGLQPPAQRPARGLCVEGGQVELAVAGHVLVGIVQLLAIQAGLPGHHRGPQHDLQLGLLLGREARVPVDDEGLLDDLLLGVVVAEGQGVAALVLVHHQPVGVEVVPGLQRPELGLVLRVVPPLRVLDPPLLVPPGLLVQRQDRLERRVVLGGEDALEVVEAHVGHVHDDLLAARELHGADHAALRRAGGRALDVVVALPGADALVVGRRPEGGHPGDGRPGGADVRGLRRGAWRPRRIRRGPGRRPGRGPGRRRGVRGGGRRPGHVHQLELQVVRVVLVAVRQGLHYPALHAELRQVREKVALDDCSN